MSANKVFEEPVQDSWVDLYGHLNAAYYLVAFDNVSWRASEAYGIGSTYFDNTGCAFYNLESHIRYLKDVKAPAVLEVEHLILGAGTKFYHMGMIMRVEGVERATWETLYIHFDSKAGRTVPIPHNLLANLQANVVDPWPDWVGSSVKPATR